MFGLNDSYSWLSLHGGWRAFNVGFVLVSTVKVRLNLHQQLDALVLDAYGWPADLSDDDILARLLALNLQRHAEEQKGVVRWLRPEYQIPRFAKSQPGLALADDSAGDDGDDGDADGGGAKKGGPIKVSRRKLKEVARAETPWPSALKDQVQAVKTVWTALSAGERNAEEVATRFVGVEVAKVREVLEMMAGLGVL